MRTETSPLPIHPALFVLFPIVSLLAANSGTLRMADAARASAILLLGAGAFGLLFSLLMHSPAKAAIVTSVTMLILLSYGHAYSILKTISIEGYVVGRHRFLIPALLAVLALTVWRMARHRGSLSRATQVLNLIAAFALVQPALTIAREVAAELTSAGTEAPGPAPAAHDRTLPAESDLPDIYYIITDAYARADVLLDEYGYDNSTFEQGLVDRGFYIAERSAPNYLWTDLSLASALNMDYIPNLIPGWTQGSPVDTTPLVQRSRVRQRLEGLGYATVGFATGLHATELFDADYVLTPDISQLELLRQQGMFNDLEGLLVHGSALRILEDLDAASSTPVGRYISQRQQRRFQVQREIILAEFENLARVPTFPGPKFVFVHIISPHAPYLFGADGEERSPRGPFTLSPTGELTLEQETSRYLDQLAFVSSRLEETVATLLSESDRPVIIILQSDHGPSLGLEWENPEAGPLQVKASILNAYYLPPDCRPQLYSGISPVNTFRVVFNCVFGEDLPLLDDVTFFGVEEFIPLDVYLDSLP